jgi:hypothetical protein
MGSGTAGPCPCLTRPYTIEYSGCGSADNSEATASIRSGTGRLRSTGIQCLQTLLLRASVGSIVTTSDQSASVWLERSAPALGPRPTTICCRRLRISLRKLFDCRLHNLWHNVDFALYRH